MTNEEVSFRAKQHICSNLKELMQHKSFSKITVSELTKKCNINRNTFYYHFEDIYAALKWMFEQEAIEIVKQYDLLLDYEEVVSFVYDYITGNSYIINCAYDSLGRDVLKRFFYKDFRSIIEANIREHEKNLNITVTDDFRNFIATLYTEGLAGMLINLAQNPKKYQKEQLGSYFRILIHTTIPSLIKGFDEENKAK